MKVVDPFRFHDKLSQSDVTYQKSNREVRRMNVGVPRAMANEKLFTEPPKKVGKYAAIAELAPGQELVISGMDKKEVAALRNAVAKYKQTVAGLVARTTGEGEITVGRISLPKKATVTKAPSVPPNPAAKKAEPKSTGHTASLKP